MRKYSCNIVTFYNAINYGAILQTYALKKAMSTLCSTYIFKYHNPHIVRIYSISPFSSCSLREMAAKLIRFIPNAKKKFRFKSFEKKYLTNNKPILKELFYITGSDQVWNYNCTDFDKTYFLDFVEDKKLKNSYAASFGIEKIPDEYKAEYKKLLSDFNMISVREKSGQKIIKDLIGIDVPVTIDPTLLLTEAQWAADFCKRHTKKEYILVYSFSLTDTMCEFVNRLSDEKNLHVIILMPNKRIGKKGPIKRSIYKTNVSPEKWVNYFYNASYIVTNSFHGTAFSINFNKNFFVELLPPPAKVNSRLIDILELLGLSGRLITNENLKIDSPIDYAPVNEILNGKRKESLKYLEAIIDSYNE